MQEAYIFDAVRTPRGRGKKNGALHEVKPVDLLRICLEALQERNQLDTSQVDDVLIGCVTPVADQGGDIAKAALLFANWDNCIPGIQLNRLCASGLDAVNLGAAKIRSGWEQLIVAGGVESMSRVPLGNDGGPMVFDPAVNIKIGYLPQGVSADLIATMEGYSREQLDKFALQSQQRTQEAVANNYFKNSLIPVADFNGLMILEKDEHPRPETTLEGLAALSPSFARMGALGCDAVAQQKFPFLEKIYHHHTAGNSSGIVDGAATVLIGSEQVGKNLGLKPRAKIISASTISSDPTLMFLGSISAAKKALDIIGMKKEDIDLWEMNEAFASAVLKFQNDLEIDPNKLNVNGGAIALGHPVGATGSILIGTILDEMERRDLNTGLISLCVGAGMGSATIIERV